jgi:hypothetical protein
VPHAAFDVLVVSTYAIEPCVSTLTTFRHRGLTTALAHEGKSLLAISVQLGHSSTAVTDRHRKSHLKKIAPTELVAQVRDRCARSQASPPDERSAGTANFIRGRRSGLPRSPVLR